MHFVNAKVILRDAMHTTRTKSRTPVTILVFLDQRTWTQLIANWRIVPLKVSFCWGYRHCLGSHPGDPSQQNRLYSVGMGAHRHGQEGHCPSLSKYCKVFCALLVTTNAQETNYLCTIFTTCRGLPSWTQALNLPTPGKISAGTRVCWRSMRLFLSRHNVF